MSPKKKVARKTPRKKAVRKAPKKKASSPAREEAVIQETVAEAPSVLKPREWKCHCTQKLGEFDAEEVLRIKYSALRVQVRMDMGTVTVICPNCGWVATWNTATDGKVSVEMPTALT